MNLLVLWRYAGAGPEKEYIDFGVLENILLRGVIWRSSLAAMSVEILTGSQGFNPMQEKLSRPSRLRDSTHRLLKTIPGGDLAPRDIVCWL
jgi:hypothetical protein